MNPIHDHRPEHTVQRLQTPEADSVRDFLRCSSTGIAAATTAVPAVHSAWLDRLGCPRRIQTFQVRLSLSRCSLRVQRFSALRPQETDQARVPVVEGFHRIEEVCEETDPGRLRLQRVTDPRTAVSCGDDRPDWFSEPGRERMGEGPGMSLPDEVLELQHSIQGAVEFRSHGDDGDILQSVPGRFQQGLIRFPASVTVRRTVLAVGIAGRRETSGFFLPVWLRTVPLGRFLSLSSSLLPLLLPCWLGLEFLFPFPATVGETETPETLLRGTEELRLMRPGDRDEGSFHMDPENPRLRTIHHGIIRESDLHDHGFHRMRVLELTLLPLPLEFLLPLLPAVLR